MHVGISPVFQNPGHRLSDREVYVREGTCLTADTRRRLSRRNCATVARPHAEDCANALALLVTDLSGYVTEQCISVCGGTVLTPS